MDVSLDDYISKSNFKVQIGNTGFKGNQNVRSAPGGGFQTGKKKFGPGPQGNKVTDYSVTVPSVKKTVTNVNRTNPVRDAREKLQPKKPLDARDKLNKKQNVDARQKLITIRSGKDPAEAPKPFDAREKLKARKQPTGPVQADTIAGGFALTRTVTNNAGAAPVVGPGAPQLTRTLTKVMPPGYENIGTAFPQPNAPKQQKPPSQQQSVKLRLGPQQGNARPLENLTRTVSNNPPPRPPPQHQFPPDHLAPRPGPHSQPHAPPPPHMYPHTVQIIHQAPPPRHHAPPPREAPPPERYAPPPPQQVHPGGHQPLQLYHYPGPEPVSPIQIIPPLEIRSSRSEPPYPIESREIGPPYPVERRDNVPPYPVDTRAIVHPLEEGIPNPNSLGMPRIQVRNDQYRREPAPAPQPLYRAPPTRTYSPPPSRYTYTSPEPQPVYQAVPDEPSYQRVIPRSPSQSGMFVKTIVNESPRMQTTSHPGLKRRSAESTGPLRMSSTNTVPLVRAPENEGSVVRDYKYTKAVIPLQEPAVKKPREQEDESSVISPLQGYRIVIINLHSSVSQEDVIELFGAIGAVRRVRMVKAGLAEVVYVKKEDAINAVKTYNDRELDGMPMTVKMSTPATARVKEVCEKLPPSVKPAASEPLKFNKRPEGSLRDADKKGVDVGVLHKALFKTGTSQSAKPVTFTVNI